MDASDVTTRLGRQVVAALESSLVPPQDPGRPLVLGHRGAPAPGRPDNSAAAVSAAVRQGADGVEIDVRLTADGVLVCAHDGVARTRSGGSAEVSGSRAVELRDAAGRPLATLAELLAAAQSPAGRRVVVEVKPVPDPALAVRTARVLADQLRVAAGTADVVVSSFDPALLALARAACADLPVRTALLGESAAAARDTITRAAADGHDEVHLSVAAVRRDEGAVERARRLGLSVALWTVNRAADLRWAGGLGVDAVITDDVPGARRELAPVAAAA